MLPTALNIPGYELAETLHEAANTVICRAKRPAESDRAILKILKADYPTLEQITRLKHEYKITQHLDLEGVVRVYQMLTVQHRLVLVSEDFGGRSLQQYLSEELLTGQLPFQSDEPLELVHCHLAREPIAIEQLNPSIPTVVAAIVLGDRLQIIVEIAFT